MYMDDIKLFAKDKKELEILIQKIRTCNKYCGIELGIEKLCHHNNCE